MTDTLTDIAGHAVIDAPVLIDGVEADNVNRFVSENLGIALVVKGSVGKGRLDKGLAVRLGLGQPLIVEAEGGLAARVMPTLSVSF